MVIEKNSTIGIIGGGQLAKMLTDAAHGFGFKVIVLDPSPEACAGKIADIHLKGEYDDGRLLKVISELSDVVTYEFENVPAVSLDVLNYFNAYLPQGARPLYLSQHRIREKNAVSDLGVKTASYLSVTTRDELYTAIEKIKFPAILKTCSGGYDGKDQWILKSEEDLENVPFKEKEKMEYILEEMIKFKTELSCVVIRNLDDEIVTFPVGENIHENGILKNTIVPARVSQEILERVENIAKKVMTELDFIGILALEFFLGENEEIYFNEMAPRPHNSCHYSMDACNFSQFQLHIMSICGMKLEQPKLNSNCVMINILGDNKKKVEKLEEKEYRKIHLYGKDKWIPGRKMGHINLVGDNLDKLIKKANCL